VKKSPALSLTARPGPGDIRGRRVAILVADGVEDDALRDLLEQLVVREAVPRLVGMKLGGIQTTAGERQVDTTVEATPAVLYDAVVLPPGVSKALAVDGRVLEFLKDQYRHCKPLLVLGDGARLLEKTGIPASLPSGGADPGLVIGATADARAAIDDFVTALGKHRHFERESDPPRI
jgi:catalase